MKYISFYTGHYQRDAKELIKTFDKLGITNYEVDPKDCTGKWVENTQIKAPFILEKLKENDAVVWTDADSRIRQHPSFFDTIDTDVGFFFLDRKYTPNWKPPENSLVSNADRFLQSGTMFFKNTDRTIALLEMWIAENEKNRSQWDQWTLQWCLGKIDGITITELPPEYVWIDGVAKAYTNKPPVIEHTQASRRTKKILR